MTSNSNHKAQDTDVSAEEKQDVVADLEGDFANNVQQIDTLKADLAAMEDRWMRSEAEIC